MISGMKPAAKSTLIAVACALVMFSSTATQARADDEEIRDARLTGYKADVKVGGGYAGAFALTGLMTLITIGLLFKDSNRSHLD